MHSAIRYVTYVSLSLGNKWQWTKPRGTPLASFRAAENMVCARLLEDKKMKRNFSDFGNTLRKEYPEIVAEAQQYIGETREVELLNEETPSQFQVRFHEVQFVPEEEEEEVTEEEVE